MAPFPNVPSFFKSEISSRDSTQNSVIAPADTDEGLPSEGINTAFKSCLPQWQPKCEYRQIDIDRLVPGPSCLSLRGRIVNLYQQQRSSQFPNGVEGCWRLIVRDDTGAILVKLFYKKVCYQIRLGYLVSIWTPHTSQIDTVSPALPNASLAISIFPERDHASHFMIHTDSDDGTLCKKPQSYRPGRQLVHLFTLKSFIQGGHEVAGGKIMVCVKSIGGKRMLATKKGHLIEKMDVIIFDHTTEATLTLWGYITLSASAWQASQTILVLTNAGLREGRRNTILIEGMTHVDVDPSAADATWLRDYVQRLTKPEHVNLPFPENVFDIKTWVDAEQRMLFTLADIDDFVRSSPNETYMGYLHLMIMELNIITLSQRKMLLCSECCGIPIFANTITATCKQCSNSVPLRINPRLVGTLIDESGSIACGGLVWSDAAWEDLLGRTAQDLAQASKELLAYLEHRLLFMRVTLLFGWSGELKKLCVCMVKTL